MIKYELLMKLDLALDADLYALTQDEIYREMTIEEALYIYNNFNQELN